MVPLNVTVRSRCTMKVNRFLNLNVAGSGSPSFRDNTFFWVPPPNLTFSAKLKTDKEN